MLKLLFILFEHTWDLFLGVLLFIFTNGILPPAILAAIAVAIFLVVTEWRP